MAIDQSAQNDWNALTVANGQVEKTQAKSYNKESVGFLCLSPLQQIFLLAVRGECGPDLR